MRVERKRMGDMLLAEGAVTAEQIDEALEASKRERIKLGESLVRLSYVTEDTIAQALSNQLKIERVHLAEEFVDDSFVKMIPGDVLRRYIMIPLCYEKDNVNRVRVAMSDPMDIYRILSERTAILQSAHMRILEIQPISSFIYGNPGWKSYYCALYE